MSKILPPISIREILKQNLAIPSYQRPYKWRLKHVIDLITDVEREWSAAAPKEDGYRYRIGAVILHKDGEEIHVVDGQQRLLTMGLILSVISLDSVDAFPLFNRKFDNPISLDNMSYNREHIVRYFKNWEEEKKKLFADYLLDGCEMIVIQAGNIAEAFQLFDSQNARGKELDPADLLKAYHLRAMIDEHEKRMCVQRWEEAIDRKVLYPVLSEVIYRCRRWMRRDSAAYDFGNEEIEEFKGADVDLFKGSKSVAPYQQRLFVISRMNVFSIDEPIANGRRFFDYVDHYISLFDELFPDINDYQVNRGDARFPRDNKKQDLFRRKCFYSPKMYRMGDKRLRNALSCLLMAYYDKFGEAGYEEFFKIVYQYVFQLRLELVHIKKESIRDFVLQGYVPGDRSRWGNEVNPFEWVAESYRSYPSELRTKLRLGEPFTVDNLNSKVTR